MGLKNPFKLEKLKIMGYTSRRRSAGDLVGTFEAMFNPESFKQKFAILYGSGQGRNSTGKEVDYQRSKPSELALKLVLDGTGVSEFGIMQFTQKKVSERVKQFLDLTFRMNGDIHAPNYLVVEWGDLIFSCRLVSVEITYQSFNRSGHALRAELDVKLISDKASKKRLKEEDKKSADLTHRRIVKSGDTLPLLTREVYGSSVHYLRVAEFNGLNGFRDLSPGGEIVFPPLEASEN